MIKTQEKNTPETMSGENAVAKLLRIAIDGPAGAGKSTVARQVAQKLGYLYVDTGAMYRAVTWLVLEKGLDRTDGKTIAKAAKDSHIRLIPGDDSSDGKVQVFIDGQDITNKIRTPQVTELVSPLSSLPAIRRLLVEQQRELSKSGGIVLDGRDIGTVVIPDADVKVFLTASAEVRAKRRKRELHEQGIDVDYDALLADINARDRRDETRADSPLKQAEDAVVIISDNMTIDDVVSAVVRLCEGC